MIKVVYLVNRKDGWSYEEFLEYWKNTHVPMSKQQPNLQKYTTSVPANRADVEYDGMAQLYFDSMADLEETLESDIKAEIQADVAKFLDLETTKMMVLEEEVQ